MQRHERLFKIGKIVGPARADHGSHQFDRGTGEGEIRLGRNGRPFRVMLSRALVPFLVQVSEQAGTGIEPVHRARARPRHVDIEDFRERRLTGQEREVARHATRSTSSSQAPAGSARVADTTRAIMRSRPSAVAVRKQSSLSAKWA